MSKKKKFAGKKTKLAKHALTQALEQEQSESPTAVSPATAVGTLAQALQSLRHDHLPLHPPLFADHTQANASEAVATRQYLAVIKELEDIREILRAPGVSPRRRLEPSAWTLLAPDILSYSLQIIGHILREIRSLMS